MKKGNSKALWAAVRLSGFCFGAAVVLLAGFASGCCMWMGGAMGLNSLKLPLSVRIVDEATGTPIENATLRLDPRYPPWGMNWGQEVLAQTDAAGWATIEDVPYVLEDGRLESDRPWKLVYLQNLSASASGYSGRSVTGTRLYNRGMHGMEIPLRRKDCADDRTVPVEVRVVEDADGSPIAGAGVYLRWEWTRDGMRWLEDLEGKTDAGGCVRFRWTPPPGFADAATAWKQPAGKFKMEVWSYGTEQRWGYGVADGISTNSVELRLQRSWYDRGEAGAGGE